MRRAGYISQKQYVPPAGAITGEIPMSLVPVYELDDAGDGQDANTGIKMLFDGIVKQTIVIGFGKVDPNDVFMFELHRLFSNITITKVSLYHNTGTGSPTVISSLTDLDATPQQLVSDDGSEPGGAWYDYIVSQANVKYLMLTAGNYKPSQMKVFGTYTPKAPEVLFPLPQIPYRNMCGVDAFEWNYLDDNGDHRALYAPAVDAFKAVSFVRHYLDWQKLENIQGQYTFSPTNPGGWDYDIMYAGMKANGIKVMACIKTQAPWMLATYPSNLQNVQNATVLYASGAQADKSLKASYIDVGKVVFQFAARYGNNQALDPSLVTPFTQTQSSGDIYNIKQIGLNIVEGVEINNETDAWWMGLLRYQNAHEFAMNLSVCWDGHKNSMGPGVGVKNADPNMKMIMGGTAGTTVDYFRGIVSWSRKYRGYKSDGVTVDIPMDAVVYHFYANGSGVSQSGGTQGVCPEQSTAVQTAIPIVQEARIYNLPVYINEIGYDQVTGSPIAAFAIGSKSIEDVKADWILRTSLLFPRVGVSRIYFFWAVDTLTNNAVQFESSGIFDFTLATHRRPAADFLFQANQLLAGYNYVTYSINADGIITDVYNNGTKNAYVVTSPTQTGFTVPYTLQGVSGPVTVYKPLKASQTMTTIGTSKTFTAGETPQFVILG